jgi:hypothetical protein
VGAAVWYIVQSTRSPSEWPEAWATANEIQCLPDGPAGSEPGGGSGGRARQRHAEFAMEHIDWAVQSGHLRIVENPARSWLWQF